MGCMFRERTKPPYTLSLSLDFVNHTSLTGIRLYLRTLWLVWHIPVFPIQKWKQNKVQKCIFKGSSGSWKFMYYNRWWFLKTKLRPNISKALFYGVWPIEFIVCIYNKSVKTSDLQILVSQPSQRKRTPENGTEKSNTRVYQKRTTCTRGQQRRTHRFKGEKYSYGHSNFILGKITGGKLK